MIQRLRADYEAEEQQRLHPGACCAAESQGREHPESQHPLRTSYQRDRDRIIHCSAFRRLEAKTQVFFDPASDYCRTRLTHTIEVAQVARTIARTLRLNEDLTEAVALAHDLGHPPFGHCGEGILNRLMAEHGGFEHNAHSLRVVTLLEHPYPDFRGLNLTWETRLSLARHESRYDSPAIQEQYGDWQAPLEGQVVDMADRIAYNSHDLDDALAADLITEHDLRDIDLYQSLRGAVEAHYPHARRHARQLRTAKLLIETLATDLMTTTAGHLYAVALTGSEQVTAASERLVTLSEGCAGQLEQLEQFLYERVYRHPTVARADEVACRALTRLFEHYTGNPGALPPRYARRIDEEGLHRVVCDYLAGMTDRYCLRCCDGLTDGA